MSRDIMNKTYYISSGGQVPVKWTAPEVNILDEKHPTATLYIPINTLSGNKIQEVLHCQ